jgi:hypothetical protein
MIRLPEYARGSNSPIAASIAQAAADGARLDRRQHHFVVLGERNDIQWVGAEEHHRESIRKALTDELRQQIARDLGFDRPAAPGLVGQVERIDRAPVARQHPLVHAAAAVHQHDDLGAVPGPRHLRLGPPRAG